MKFTWFYQFKEFLFLNDPTNTIQIKIYFRDISWFHRRQNTFSLLVALSANQGSAQGDLYIDDSLSQSKVFQRIIYYNSRFILYFFPNVHLYQIKLLVQNSISSGKYSYITFAASKVSFNDSHWILYSYY